MVETWNVSNEPARSDEMLDRLARLENCLGLMLGLPPTEPWRGPAPTEPAHTADTSPDGTVDGHGVRHDLLDRLVRVEYLLATAVTSTFGATATGRPEALDASGVPLGGPE